MNYLNYCKISVLVVTYNQESVIGRAIESILCQKEYGLYEIVICDDCSKDRTWEIIQDYHSRFPELVRPYRNNYNLGIYGNHERVVSLRGDADFFTFLAGDDVLCDGWFETIQSFINEHSIKHRNVSMAIYSDWKIITPDGQERIYSNNLIAENKYKPVSLKLRGLICTRSTLQSAELLNRHTPVDLNHGVSRAETMFDEQEAKFSDVNYYCPFIGSAYYSGIGFSLKTNTIAYEKEVLYNKQEQLKSNNWDEYDKAYIQYSILKSKLIIEPHLIDFFSAIYYYFKSQRRGLPNSNIHPLKLFTAMFINSFVKK